MNAGQALMGADSVFVSVATRREVENEIRSGWIYAPNVIVQESVAKSQTLTCDKLGALRQNQPGTPFELELVIRGPLQTPKSPSGGFPQPPRRKNHPRVGFRVITVRTEAG
jgi:hypothetical protein